MISKTNSYFSFISVISNPKSSAAEIIAIGEINNASNNNNKIDFFNIFLIFNA